MKKSGIYKCILYCNRSFWLIVVCFYGFQCNSSAVCESLKGFFFWFTDCLTIGIIHETMVVHMTWVRTFFNNYSNHPRMCVLSTLCGNVDKHSPFDFIYIYIFNGFLFYFILFENRTHLLWFKVIYINANTHNVLCHYCISLLYIYIYDQLSCVKIVW